MVAAQGSPLTNYGVGSSKQVSDLIDKGVSISWAGKTGTVNGQIKNISEPWLDFDHNGDNTGHFFPVELDSSFQGKKITVVGKKQRSAADRYWVLRVENGNNKKFTFKLNDIELFTLDFSKANLVE